MQFYDVTSHPTYPHIYGGGYQDNGTWVSYGGPTWYYLFGGDGGAMAFQHGDAHRFLTTWQGGDNDKRSLDRVAVISQPDPRPNAGIASSLPDVPGTGADGGPPFLKYVARDTDITDDFQLKHRGIFGGKLQGHPTDPNHWIMARVGAAYVSKPGTTLESEDGPEFQKLDLRDDDVEVAEGNKVETSAIAYAASDPDNEWWIGTTHGGLFRTDDGGAHWSSNIAPMGHLRATFTNHSANPAGGITASGAVNVAFNDLIVVNYAARSVMAGPLAFTDNLGNVYAPLSVASSGAGRVQPFFATSDRAPAISPMSSRRMRTRPMTLRLWWQYSPGPFDAAPLAKNPSASTDFKLAIRMPGHGYADRAERTRLWSASWRRAMARRRTAPPHPSRSPASPAPGPGGHRQRCHQLPRRDRDRVADAAVHDRNKHERVNRHRRVHAEPPIYFGNQHSSAQQQHRGSGGGQLEQAGLHQRQQGRDLAT